MENSNNSDNSDNSDIQRRPGSSRIWIGLILFLAGLGLFANKLGLPLPPLLFTWPMILIVIGIIIGVKDRFHNPGSWIMLLIGFIFLADQQVQGFDFHRFIGPIILIAVGLSIILRPKHHQKMDRFRESFINRQHKGFQVMDEKSEFSTNKGAPGDIEPEYVNINSVFGGVKKYIISKNFQGGNIVTFMGGAELNLLQADVQQPVILEVNNVFGGTKLIVPSNWDIKNEVTAIFGGVEDKRNFNTISPEPGKTVLIKGTCLFGGIEISGY